MGNVKAAQARRSMGTMAAAAAMLLGAWCGPALGSSGIDMLCPESDTALEDSLESVTPTLASHNESALQDILDDTAVATLPALAEAASDAVIEDVDEGETLEEQAVSRARTPAITTRLPGVPESSLPNFRRQMHRTDI